MTFDYGIWLHHCTPRFQSVTVPKIKTNEKTNKRQLKPLKTNLITKEPQTSKSNSLSLFVATTTYRRKYLRLFRQIPTKPIPLFLPFLSRDNKMPYLSDDLNQILFTQKLITENSLKLSPELTYKNISRLRLLPGAFTPRQNRRSKIGAILPGESPPYPTGPSIKITSQSTSYTKLGKSLIASSQSENKRF